MTEAPAPHGRDALQRPEAMTPPAQLLDEVGLEGEKESLRGQPAAT